MSAKRARKPLTELSSNLLPPAKKQKKAAHHIEPTTQPPETFVPINHPALEHHAEARVPKIAWNTLDGLAIRTPEGSGDVLAIRWEDNNIVRFLTTVHPWNETTLSERRKPRSTSTNATAVRRVFGDSHRKLLFIPTVVDDYNHHMNGVDLADQRRAAYTTHQRSQRNWMSLFWFLLDISLVNAHILFLLRRHTAFLVGIDSGDIQPELVGTHQLGRDYSAERFVCLL